MNGMPTLCTALEATREGRPPPEKAEANPRRAKIDASPSFMIVVP
jgi:hypothetical protein